MPWIKTLEQFEFQPSIDQRVVRELSELSFVKRAHGVVLPGPPWAGKTHLALVAGLGVEALEAGYISGC